MLMKGDEESGMHVEGLWLRPSSEHVQHLTEREGGGWREAGVKLKGMLAGLCRCIEETRTEVKNSACS